jgi:hypothetical protein
MSRTPLVSVNVRREAREYLVGWTLREIGDLFHDHGFSADMTHDPQTSGERRTYVRGLLLMLPSNSHINSGAPERARGLPIAQRSADTPPRI